jgi:hypothetical protein
MTKPLLFAGILSMFVFTAYPASAAYKFINVADNTGTFSSFSVPAINSNGIAAFRGVGGGTGVYTGNGGAVSPIDDPAFGGIGGAPSINDSGLVAFLAILSGQDGIFASTGGPYTTIFDSSGSYSTFASPKINSSGDVAVFATLDAGGGNAIIRGNGGAITTIVSTSGPYSTPFGISSPPDASGRVVFTASLDAGGEGIFVGSGGPISTVVDSSGTLDSFRSPSVNAGGTVAFAATLDAGEQGIFLVDISGGPVTPIADTSGAFDFFSLPSINASGQIVFLADLDSGEEGLYLGANPVTDKLIQTGDMLFGSTVTDLNYFAAGFNDAGQVAFHYTLGNGVVGIAIASVVPEPASIVLVSAFAAALTLGARRRQSARAR